MSTPKPSAFSTGFDGCLGVMAAVVLAALLMLGGCVYGCGAILSEEAPAEKNQR